MITAGIELALVLVVWVISGSPGLTVAHAETLLFEVWLPVVALYAPLLLARRGEHNGQTIGKQALGIRVIRDDGEPLIFATALVREILGRQLPAALTSGLYLLIDYMWPLRDPSNQALHDKIGRTFVVSTGDSAPGAEQPVRGDWLPPRAPSPLPASAPDET